MSVIKENHNSNSGGAKHLITHTARLLAYQTKDGETCFRKTKAIVGGRE